jgi:hypothetical protein
MSPRPWQLFFRAGLALAVTACTDGEGASENPPGTGGGAGTPAVCSFAIESTPSAAIPTVGIVDWSTDLAGLAQARVEFTLDDPAAHEINTGGGGEVDVSGTSHRALLLGLKAERTYTYRIVATGGGRECTSPDQKFSTGAATDAPTLTRTVHDSAARARGFIVTNSPSTRVAYIVDTDGDVVWWTAASGECSRALLDFEGASLWMVDANPSVSAGGRLRRIGMDGTGGIEEIAGFDLAHHDIAALPGGIVTALVWTGDTSAASALVERSPDGTLETVARLDTEIFHSLREDGELHANSLLYHPPDDSYTVSDLYASAYVKISRRGELLWQFGADCEGALTPKCATGEVSGNHGHHLLDDGNLVFFNASPSQSVAREYILNGAESSFTAEPVWSYAGNGVRTITLGDVQRLPNGNTLIDFSNDGELHEVSPTGELVQILEATNLGYANFRESLYGPPLR